MKKYLTKMKKYYFILIAMLTMSVNAMAQTTQKHLFPEVVFDWTKDGVTYQYVVPAWDALTAKKERVQKVIDPSSGGDGPGGDDGGGDDTGGEDGGDTGGDTGGDDTGGDDGGSTPSEPDPDGPGWGTGGGGALDGDIILGSPAKAIRRAKKASMDGIIVASACAIDKRGIDYHNGFSPRGSFDPATITIDGVEYNSSTVTYGDIFGDAIPEGLKSQKLLQSGSTTYISGDYTIPETVTAFSQDESASSYNIVGIGDGAYYNSTLTHGAKVFFRATSLTIPKHIKSLGMRCFTAAGNLTKITIADDSEIEELPDGCFAHCQYLREINIPASVTKIQAGALGGCKVLGKIVFAADQTPTIDDNAFVKIGSSSATNVTKENCAVWVSSMDVIRNFRTYNAIWKDFAFCVPFVMPKQMISYCSEDLNISPSPLVLGEYGKDAENAWTAKKYSDTHEIGGDTLKIFYINKKYLEASNNTIRLYQLETSVPQFGDGFLLAGDPGTHDLYVRAIGKGTAMSSNNLLVGTTEPTDMGQVIANAGNNDIYLLKDGKFHICDPNNPGTLAANKAYLKLPNNTFPGRTQAKEINIEFGSEEDGETNGVQDVVVTNHDADDTWFTLQGVQVDTPTRGIFIRGGKKYVIK